MMKHFDITLHWFDIQEFALGINFWTFSEFSFKDPENVVSNYAGWQLQIGLLFVTVRIYYHVDV